MSSTNEGVLIKDLIVVKRSGQRVEFNSTKIAIAIKKSFDQVIPSNSEKQINKIYEEVLQYIQNNYADRKTINVEDIQDIIEAKLKEKNIEVYQAFNEYRIRRAASRKAFNMKQLHKFTKAIERIVDQNREAKNINDSPNEILLDFGKTIASEYTKTYVLDNKLVRAHEEGSIYIHNLDYFHLGKISDTHIILNSSIHDDFSRDFIFDCIKAKYEIDGEIAIDALDKQLVAGLTHKFKIEFMKMLTNYLQVTDYVDYINIKKIEEIVEKESKINFDISLFSQFILNEKVGKIFKQAYQDALSLVQESLAELLEDLLNNLNDSYQENQQYSISIGGEDSFESTLITQCYLEKLESLEPFPNVTTIFKIKKENTSELLPIVSRLIIEGKNIAFAFVDTSYNHSETSTVEYFSNGKRIFENPIYEEKNSNGRMIVSSVSINMGRLGFKYENKNLEDFYLELNELLEVAKNCLVTVFETIGNKNKDNYRIIFNGNILDDDKLEYGQKIRKILKKGVLNLELAGLTECVLNLEKDVLKQKQLLYEIIQYATDKCKKYSADTKLNFMVSETCKNRPLKKLMELDKAIYGVQKNITDKDCYGRMDELFKFKKDIREDLHYIGQYQEKLSGGNLVKIILNKNTNVKEILNIVKIAIAENVGFLKLEIRK